MQICKDCFHYDVCKIIQYPSLFGLTGDGCDHFKNNVIELSDDNIMYVKDKWLVLNTESDDLGKAIKTCMDYLTKDVKGQ